ncbi:hypothetical protein Ais01nite_12510 [Asanoa ishikariensis]|uniref:DUF4034 domain-containing protein n=1 Tax=Asanoa ishikariensis TaxID=137265 RepID=A0A1H3SZW6_9ACTN|nr:DUF4034 domain-containing protein [Asanoa ishikariensis]GIF63216.1 hypothetical protein Ais01nite_12510 [Asanoa ishikariensis]SDZ43320.1 protein of unknown function [Asanoa ishikariensis]
MGLFKRAAAAPDIVFDAHPAQDDDALRKAHDDLVAGGDWAVARDLLATTAGDEDRRARYVWVLSEATVNGAPAAPGPVEDATWVDAWARAEPGNPDALLVRGRSLISRAWEVRGGGWASTVGADAVSEFHRLLVLAVPLYDRAAHLAEADPLPWVHRLILATALNAPRDQLERCWSEVVMREPGHVEAHNFKLMYLCHKWHGSHEEMFAFAREAAATAPDGSPLKVLPLKATAEWDMWMMRRELTLKQSVAQTGHWRRDPGLHAELDAALHRWFARPARRHGCWYDDLNQLAYALWRADRHADNKAVIAAIGPYMSDLPWGWSSEKTGAHAFLKARKAALKA